ncbi:MAG: TIGR03905 family TSCPD domain-containing protein [Erysipelotrichaceae bacterium]|nr:TIGR03905 family TSCPD domain-containing protein [Erysipelotrichaceae bacterium]
MRYEFKPSGVCSTKYIFELEDNRIVKANVIGGCDGNLQAICRLIEGSAITDVIGKLQGIRCGFKKTSCPDQMAKALSAYLAS